MTSKLRGTIAQEVKQLSRDWGVILESGTRLPEFTELSLEGLGLPSENVAKKRALLASLGHKRYYKLSGSGPNTKIIARTCLVNLQRFIPLPLHPLLLDPHLSTTYEHEEEFRSGCLEVIHMSRLSGCRPARYNRQARSDDDRQFQNVLAYWLARNGAIDPKRPIKLPGRLKECASQNRSFHVRVV